MLKEDFLKALVAEDVGRGDLFSRISSSKPIRAFIIAKSDGVFAGQEYVSVLAEMYDLTIEFKVDDG
jgi:nicotinate-nucleotide pyrophosphorylase (carboxylating)